MTDATMNTTYATIVADPPWPSMHQRSTYHRGKPERHYNTMTVAEIAALPVSDIADTDAHLWVWGVNRMLGEAYRVIDAWGFTPMTMLTWCKRGPGMGYYLRNNTEHAILATRGKPMVPSSKPLSSWYVWDRLRHSEKPSEFFAIVEEVSPGPYLEMFARAPREGWDVWGDQAPNSIDLGGAACSMTDDDRKPELFQPKVNGVPFRCACKSNVFRNLTSERRQAAAQALSESAGDGRDVVAADIYECAACGELYEGTAA